MLPFAGKPRRSRRGRFLPANELSSSIQNSILIPKQTARRARTPKARPRTMRAIYSMLLKELNGYMSTSMSQFALSALLTALSEYFLHLFFHTPACSPARGAFSSLSTPTLCTASKRSFKKVKKSAEYFRLGNTSRHSFFCAHNRIPTISCLLETNGSKAHTSPSAFLLEGYLSCKALPALINYPANAPLPARAHFLLSTLQATLASEKVSSASANFGKKPAESLTLPA